MVLILETSIEKKLFNTTRKTLKYAIIDELKFYIELQEYSMYG